MSKPKSAAELRKKATEYKKLIDAGGLSKAKKKKYQTAYYNYLRRAKAKETKAAGVAQAAPKAKAPRQKKAPAVNAAQGFLPNFLGQLNVARIEELIADKAFKAVAQKLGISVEELKQASGDLVVGNG